MVGGPCEAQHPWVARLSLRPCGNCKGHCGHVVVGAETFVYCTVELRQKKQVKQGSVVILASSSLCNVVAEVSSFCLGNWFII